LTLLYELSLEVVEVVAAVATTEVPAEQVLVQEMAAILQLPTVHPVVVALVQEAAEVVAISEDRVVLVLVTIKAEVAVAMVEKTMVILPYQALG
jgi:hypothetical protein